MRKMTYWVFLVWPLVLLYSYALCSAAMAAGPGSLAATINSKMDENNPGSGTQLQVSVPMLMRVPSCQKAYGELELRNTVSSEQRVTKILD